MHGKVGVEIASDKIVPIRGSGRTLSGPAAGHHYEKKDGGRQSDARSAALAQLVPYKSETQLPTFWHIQPTFSTTYPHANRIHALIYAGLYRPLQFASFIFHYTGTAFDFAADRSRYLGTKAEQLRNVGTNSLIEEAAFVQVVFVGGQAPNKRDQPPLLLEPPNSLVYDSRIQPKPVSALEFARSAGASIWRD